MKAKGLSSDQIKQAMAKSGDPLDAVKPYLAEDNDSRKLANDISVDNTSEAPAKTPIAVTTAVQKDQPLVIDMDAMNAKLAAAGLDLSSPVTQSSGHGLSVQKPGKASDIIVR